MNRRAILSLSGALAATALAGCTGNPQTPADGTPTDTPTDESPSSTPTVDDERLAKLAADNAAFALDLHKQVVGTQGGNQFLSPYSISVALAMAVAGARGTTCEQMRETMHYTLGEEIHPAFADLRATLESRETTTDSEGDAVDAFQLSVANAIWGQEGYPFAEDYLALLEQHYGSGLREADFDSQPDAERQRINEWVADATEDRITDLLPQGSIRPQTVLVLVNAIYFLAGWRRPFDPAKTEDGTFAALDGTQSTVPFMHQTIRTNYAELTNAQALELPYVGEEVSMVLLLPDEGKFEAFERDLTTDQLFGIFDEMSDAQGDLAFPKFEYRTKVELKKALSEMGMPDAFSGAADFTGMVEGTEADLFIDEVYHQAFVSVDEEGTEAAGATAAVVAEVSAPPSWNELRFDRPFLFCIRDRPTGAILFFGRVVDAGDAQSA